VELCVAEAAHYGQTKPPELNSITYDGSIADDPHFVVMGAGRFVPGGWVSTGRAAARNWEIRLGQRRVVELSGPPLT
jgi:hypothetical protein